MQRLLSLQLPFPGPSPQVPHFHVSQKHLAFSGLPALAPQVTGNTLGWSAVAYITWMTARCTSVSHLTLNTLRSISYFYTPQVLSRSLVLRPVFAE